MFRRASSIALIVLALVAACVPRIEHVPPPGSAQPDSLPVHQVLFIHGWNGGPMDFDRFWTEAVRRLPPNCEVTIVTGLGRLMGGLSENNDEILADFIRFLDSQDIPRENLHLVAHSMGGLLARRYATLHPEGVRQIFLLGTPSGGVRAFHGVNPGGWCTPTGIAEFNQANPPAPDTQWFVLAGDHYRDPISGAILEGHPNDGVVATASVLHFVELCADTVACESAVMDLSHPDWNWGEDLLRSDVSIDWVLSRIATDCR